MHGADCTIMAMRCDALAVRLQWTGGCIDFRIHSLWVGNCILSNIAVYHPSSSSVQGRCFHWRNKRLFSLRAHDKTPFCFPFISLCYLFPLFPLSFFFCLFRVLSVWFRMYVYSIPSMYYTLAVWYHIHLPPFFLLYWLLLLRLQIPLSIYYIHTLHNPQV